MPMPQRVQYPESIEPLVQFIEDTAPEEILDRALDKLRDGVSIETMLTASALAVTRSTEMPPGHHGGPLHPLAGLYAVTKLIERLEGEQKFVPVLQHVALTNKHINHPAMGPYQLLEYEPQDAGGFEEAKAAWLMAVGRGEWNLADHLFLSLWQTAPAIEVFDLLMSVAITKNWNDDHYFMFPGAMWRAFETGVLDKAYLPLLMRPVVRYVTRSPVLPLNPVPNPMPQIEALIEEHGLLTRIHRQRTGKDETKVVGQLGNLCRHKVGLHVERVESVVHLPHDGRIADAIAERHGIDRIRRIRTEENGHLRFRGKIRQLRTYSLQLTSDLGDFGIHPVGLQVVRQHTFPVGLLAVVQRRPMPVGDHVGPGGDVGVGCETELTGVRRVLRS